MSKTATESKMSELKKRKIERVLITLPKPESEKSPYFEIARKYDLQMEFFPFIRVEGLNAKEFRKQRIELDDYTAVILVSRNAVDHFFRICEELKYKVPSDLKYFCATEAVALYLQKFILYRKRKVFFSPDGSSEGLVEVMAKSKDKEKFIFPVSEFTKNDVSPLMDVQGYDYTEAILYRTVGNDLTEIWDNKFDVIVFFSPFSIETLMDQYPEFKQNDTLIGAFGTTTCKAVEDFGWTLNIKAPTATMPSMSGALDSFLAENQ